MSVINVFFKTNIMYCYQLSVMVRKAIVNRGYYKTPMSVELSIKILSVAENLVCIFLLHTYHMLCPSLCLWFYHCDNIW